MIVVVAGVLVARGVLVGSFCCPMMLPMSSASSRTRSKYSSAVAGGSPACMRARISRSDMGPVRSRCKGTGRAILFVDVCSVLLICGRCKWEPLWRSCVELC